MTGFVCSCSRLLRSCAPPGGPLVRRLLVQSHHAMVKEDAAEDKSLEWRQDVERVSVAVTAPSACSSAIAITTNCQLVGA